jgi:para-aminobenzoate synthetase/4-amino-4-deoxychorismate lyase
MKFDDIINTVTENTFSAFFYTPSVYKNAKSFLFLKPAEIISVHKKDDLDFAFNHIQKFIDKGYFGYSLIKYQAGFLFEPKLEHLLKSSNENLLQFIFFKDDEVKKLKSSDIIFSNGVSEDYSVSNFSLSKSKTEFNNDLTKIKKYIKSGDTYQVNYTVKGRFDFSGSYSEFFKKLIFNQSAKFSSFINNREEFIISLSPELFFHCKGKKIISRPMKGTIRRGYNIPTDAQAIKELSGSEKNLAENVMIVDLIRNDLGKICKFGTVKVPELFTIEKYESLFQMVSEVQGKLKKRKSIQSIIENIFPCGSVTGAPKIRTMEIINEIENEQRGIYTGSIGLITPDEIKFNVAIRTITLNKNSGEGVMGLGSGIVWDSDPKSEFEEVLLKSKFLTEPEDYFEIFETMKFQNGEIKFLDEHLERMKSAAEYFLFRFSKGRIRKQIQKKIAELDSEKSKVVKILLDKWGKLKINLSDLRATENEVSVIISKSKIDSRDKFRFFKTTNRKLYDDEYAYFNSNGFYEVLYLNEKENLVEGSRTNIFFRKENTWFTSSLESGVLPGIYRNKFMEIQGDVIEKNITLGELIEMDELLLTNAVRGEVKVDKLFITESEYIGYTNRRSYNQDFQTNF